MKANETGFSSSTLDQACIGETLVVSKVTSPLMAPEWKDRLEDLGFLAGEQVRLMGKAALGGDPMVVRVGQSTFALRRVEAECIGVVPVESFAAQAIEQMAVEGSRA